MSSDKKAEAGLFAMFVLIPGIAIGAQIISNVIENLQNYKDNPTESFKVAIGAGITIVLVLSLITLMSRSFIRLWRGESS